MKHLPGSLGKEVIIFITDSIGENIWVLFVDHLSIYGSGPYRIRF